MVIAVFRLPAFPRLRWGSGSLPELVVDSGRLRSDQSRGFPLASATVLLPELVGLPCLQRRAPYIRARTCAGSQFDSLVHCGSGLAESSLKRSSMRAQDPNAAPVECICPCQAFALRRAHAAGSTSSCDERVTSTSPEC